MRNIDPYDSRYPSEYYEIGTIYSFYGSSNSTGNLKAADAEYISKYSSKLLELQEEEKTSAIQSVASSNNRTARMSLQRFYGIVVAKPRKDQIKIMLISFHDGVSNFFTKDYAVSYEGCSSDGKELMPVSSSANYKDGKNTSSQTVGGITRVKSSSNVGGITRVKPRDNSASGVGGITRVNKNSPVTSSKTHKDNHSTQNTVGGITRVKNVGGITRVKK